MGLKKKLAALVGLVLIAVSVANVELGALMGLEPPQKLILARMADPGCNSDEIQKDLDSGDTTPQPRINIVVEIHSNVKNEKNNKNKEEELEEEYQPKQNSNINHISVQKIIRGDLVSIHACK